MHVDLFENPKLSQLSVKADKSGCFAILTDCRSRYEKFVAMLHIVNENLAESQPRNFLAFYKKAEN